MNFEFYAVTIFVVVFDIIIVYESRGYKLHRSFNKHSSHH